MNSYQRPKLVENKSKGYVLNGNHNEFYQYVIDRYNGSPTNAAIINSYVDLMYGQGLIKTSGSTNDWLKVKQALKSNEIRKTLLDFQLFGEASLQVIQKNKGELSEIAHVPKQKIAPGIENKDGDIEEYFFSSNWRETTKNKPEPFPAFSGKPEKQSIYNIRPYKAGKEYFADPDYLPGLAYAEMEEEIANFYVSHIQNGLSFGYIINVPPSMVMTDEEKDNLERKIKAKLTGSSNAGKFVLSFNGAEGQSITVEALEVNDAHKQWEYLTKEARQQLMTAHRVTSPMLFGIKDGTGFGNNADEMDTAEAQLMKRVIKPKQRYILDALEEIFLKYGINIGLDFRSLSDNAASLDLAVQEPESFEHLGEHVDAAEFDLVAENEVDYSEPVELATTGTARPNAKSAQDGEDFIIRYKYRGSKTPERTFCKKMMQADKVYRREDLIQMENIAVNPGWGPKGADTYSIWLYKGGGNCHHKWFRQIYLKKGANVDVNSPLAKMISVAQAKREGKTIPTNPNEVAIEPRYLDNQGFLKK